MGSKTRVYLEVALLCVISLFIGLFGALYLLRNQKTIETSAVAIVTPAASKQSKEIYKEAINACITEPIAEEIQTNGFKTAAVVTFDLNKTREQLKKKLEEEKSKQ